MFFKKNIRYIGPILALLLISLFVVIFTSQQDMFEQTMDYDVQMADELYYSDTEIQEWVDSVRNQAGTYQRQIGQFTYLLICAGEQPSDGSALALVDTVQTEKELQIVYSLIKTSPDEVSEGVTAPFMLVRIPDQTRLTLVGKQIEEADIPSYLSQVSSAETTN